MRVVVRQGFYCMNGLNTCAQHHSKRGNTKIKTTARIYGYHPEGYESEWNGEECTGSEEVPKSYPFS